MTEDKGVATSWLEGLAARGATAIVTNGRLRILPSSAYKSLTDAEVLTLRHHRAAIKALVNDGVSFDVRTAPAAERATQAPAAPEPEPCKWCNRAPCIGAEHSAFYALHPIERQRRDDERLNAEFKACVGRPHRMWDGLL